MGSGASVLTTGRNPGPSGLTVRHTSAEVGRRPLRCPVALAGARLGGPEATDKVALERLRTAARRRGTTPPPTSRCRPPHPCAHRDSGEGAVEGCTGNAPGQAKQEVDEHGRDDAPDEHARIRVPPHIDRFPSRRLRWDHLKSLPPVVPDKDIAPDARGGSPTPEKVTLRMGASHYLERVLRPGPEWWHSGAKGVAGRQPGITDRPAGAGVGPFRAVLNRCAYQTPRWRLIALPLAREPPALVLRQRFVGPRKDGANISTTARKAVLMARPPEIGPPVMRAHCPRWWAKRGSSRWPDDDTHPSRSSANCEKPTGCSLRARTSPRWPATSR